MIDLHALILEWQDLLGFNNDPTRNDSENQLEFIREDRVLELTADYISKLREIQDDHDSHAEEFANRVRRRARNEGVDPDFEFLETMCQRLIGGLEATLFNEIPKSVPRAKRAIAKTLEITWESDPATATWKEVGVSFPLPPVLSFCAQHSAGADGDVRRLLVDQLMHDLRGGVAKIGMAFESHGDSISVLTSKPGAVTLGSSPALSDQHATAVPASAAVPTSTMPSAIEVYLKDSRQTLVAGVQLAGDMDDVVTETTLKFDDMDDLPAGHPLIGRIEGFVAKASVNNTARKDKIVDAMSSSAFFGLTIAEATNDEALFVQRGQVLKGIKRLKKTRGSREVEYA